MEEISAAGPSSTHQWKYDVFLNFRGDDTRKRFTDHLYSALESHGIKSFKDDPELQKGKAISPELFTAIEESRFALIVLSENYAMSKWCLDELLQILECMEGRETVLPIFYAVDPSDVRKQTGSFAKAFTKHEEQLRDDTDKVRRWRDALTKVANFSGWDSKDWYESELIKDIVEEVWKKLRPTLSSLVEDLVGIDSRLKPINLYLDARVDDACFIGIWGMGGIGKTTIARAFYQRNSHEFDVSIFLANVGNIVEERGLLHLQKQLLSRIWMKNDDLLDLEEGITVICRLLCGKKVLLILDDVNHLDQLKYLAGKQHWFGSGSRVFITTRNEHLLIEHGVEGRFGVEKLNEDEALQLFSSKAFKKDYPEQSYVGLCNRVVKYAKGLPLALEVLGSFLHGRGLSAWNSALGKLREVFNTEIFDTLKISYDGLDEKQKKIFLDIACFFNGMYIDKVIKMLDCCGFYTRIEIEVLCEKSLLTISKDTILMHDLLQEMGREIVRRESPDNPGRRSRLWLYEDVNCVLSENTVSDLSARMILVAICRYYIYNLQGYSLLTILLCYELHCYLFVLVYYYGTEAIEGIVFQPALELREVKVNAKSFLRMKRLRLLIIDHQDVDLPNGLEYLPRSLRILEWTDFPLNSLPSFSPDDFVSLNMGYSDIQRLRKGTEHPSDNLRNTKLSRCWSLVKTPRFRRIPHLEHLDLHSCLQMHKLDRSVLMLRRLTLMDLRNCKNLVRIPSGVSSLKFLKVLNLSGCSNIQKLPQDLGHIESLEELNLSGTAIREPPSSIGLLKNLKSLSLARCKRPSSKMGTAIFMLFPAFRSFLKVCPNPVVLWLRLLCGLRSLTFLDLSDCNLLDEEIPNDLGCQFPSLKCLYLSRNPIVSLPRSISQLSQLYRLGVMDCHRLQALPELPSSVRSVHACNCSSLETSGVDMGFEYFTNYFKRVGKQGGTSECDFAFLGNEIPEWFNHKSEGDSVSVELHPSWFTDQWMGFAFCVVFAVHGDSDGSKELAVIKCELSINGDQFPLGPSLNYPMDSPQAVAVPSQCWIVYETRQRGLNVYGVPLQNIHTRLEFSFSSSLGEVHKCGVRIVYEEDVEALIKQAEFEAEQRDLRAFVKRTWNSLMNFRPVAVFLGFRITAA